MTGVRDPSGSILKAMLAAYILPISLWPGLMRLSVSTSRVEPFLLSSILASKPSFNNTMSPFFKSLLNIVRPLYLGEITVKSSENVFNCL